MKLFISILNYVLLFIYLFSKYDYNLVIKIIEYIIYINILILFILCTITEYYREIALLCC